MGQKMKIEHFCYNKECALHNYDTPSRVDRVRVETSLGNQKDILRHKYQSEYGRPVYLCGVCHAAIQTLKR